MANPSSNDSPDERLTVRDLMGVLQSMKADLEQSTDVIIRLTNDDGSHDDAALRAWSVGGLQGIWGERGQFIIYVEATDG
jgi:hypothetical protein